MDETHYVGRYAPSPTGVLHLGNLRTALLAWLHARKHAGRLLLRIEDLDTPRVVEGATQQIMRDLDWLGLGWDGQVVYQSQRIDEYQDAYAALQKHTLLYPCFCSRKAIQNARPALIDGRQIYPGTCKNRAFTEVKTDQAYSCRVRSQGTTMEFKDLVCAEVCTELEEDFVVKRADGIFAYQLAVAYDDMAQGITHIVRGRDLLSSTPRQLFLIHQWRKLERAKSIRQAQYAHVPLMLNAQGQKISKRNRTHATPLSQQYQSPEMLIAELAYSLKLIKHKIPLSSEELLHRLEANFMQVIV